MHYSPRIWPERDPELRLIFLSLSPPAGPRPPVAAGLLAAHDRPSRTGAGSSHWHSSSRARASLTRIQHSTVPLRTRRDGSGQRSAYHRFRRRKPAPPCPKPNGIRAHCGGTLQVLRGEHIGTLRRTAADGCAEDVACPVSLFSAVQAAALGAASAYEFMFAFGGASTGRQVRVLLAMEPRKVRRPAASGLERRNPTARSSRLLSLAGSNRIGGDRSAPLHL